MDESKNEDPSGVPQPLRFSWHAEASDSFLKWLIPTVLSDVDPERLQIFSRASHQWDDIELSVFINGFYVDAEKFLEGVERNMDHAVAVEALRILQERTSLDAFDSAVEAGRKAFMQQLEALGLELPEEED